MIQMSAIDYFNAFSRKLESVYGKDEARAITDYLTSEVLLIRYHQLSIIDKTLGAEDVKYFDGVLERLLKYEPLQYILGYSWFYGLKFKVGHQVLIPRPETEELVEMVIRYCHDNKLNPRIIDLGTGSGCIPVTLKKNIPGAVVFGTDLYEKALEVAVENAWLNKTEVVFFKDDMLNATGIAHHGPFDLIISNPPYIAEHEAGAMEEHVKGHEPHTALFAPGDPLMFYRAIRQIADQCLSKEGSIWLELNPEYATETMRLFEGTTVYKTELVRDLSGKIRFAVVHKHE